MSLRSMVAPDLPRIITPKRHVDCRGWFSESFHDQRLRDIGITCRFVQDNQSSSSHAGTLRGLHFQVPPAAQAKMVTALRGKVLDVAVDVRPAPRPTARPFPLSFRQTTAVSPTFQS